MVLGKRHLSWLTLSALVLAGWATASPAQAQPRVNEQVELRNSPKFLAAFRDVVSRAGQSTVRVRADGKDVALGVAVSVDGFILTKASDLIGPITVKLADGTVMDARWVGHHDDHDLAMLKIDAQALTPLEWAESKICPVGNFVACVGTGQNPTAVGVLSVASRKMPTMKELPKGPDPNSGYLGVGLANYNKGAKVGEVMPGTAAAKAKIKVDDIITAVDDNPVKDGEALVKTLGKFKPKDTVTLRIMREDAEMELKVTLGKRPPDRADFQNNMGSKLSNRRNGFPVILQHDSVVAPEDCGGPLVDLEGRVIGINIARAGRVESYAVPAESIRPLLRDLMSGKLPPPKQ